jgi:hypothetical protein
MPRTNVAAAWLSIIGLLSMPWSAFPATNPPPYSGPVIVSACFNQTNGQLRLVKPWDPPGCVPPSPYPVTGGSGSTMPCSSGGAFDCKPQEYFLEMNTQGPQGPPGPKGDTGDGLHTYAEPPGPNCAGGGVRVVATFDGVESSFPSDVQYVCKGDPGPQGERGDTGATGAAGQAATVQVGGTTTVEAGMPAVVTNSGTASAAVLEFAIPRGPPGPPGTSAPPPPPEPYVGTFFLGMPGAAHHVVLTSFAGCFDKVAGLEYEDCYLTVSGLSPELESWLSDSRQGGAPGSRLRDLTVSQVDLEGEVTGTLEISDAFIREFGISDLDAASREPVAYRFTIVPAMISKRSGGTIDVAPPGKPPLGQFRLEISGITTGRVSAVSGLRMSVEKLPVEPQVGPRRQFQPGATTFQDVRLEVPAMDVHGFEGWSSRPDPRDGRLELLSATLADVLVRFPLFGLTPRPVPPFSTAGSPASPRTVVTLGVARFEVVVPP